MVASGHVHYFSSTFVSPCTSQLALRDIEWVRYVFPVLPVIEPGFVSIISLEMYQIDMRPSAKLLISRREKRISELQVIVVTLDAKAQPRQSTLTGCDAAEKCRQTVSGKSWRIIIRRCCRARAVEIYRLQGLARPSTLLGVTGSRYRYQQASSFILHCRRCQQCLLVVSLKTERTISTR
jgi:hypothetical protein